MSSSIKRFHVEKDAITGSKHIRDGTIPYTKLQENTIQFVVPIQLVDHVTGLAADSTGTKWESGRFKFIKKNLKEVKMRATWTASHSDSVAEIQLYNVDLGAIVAELEGNAGTDREVSASLDNILEDYLHEIRVRVKTASATSGATMDVIYVVLELIYGIG